MKNLIRLGIEENLLDGFDIKVSQRLVFNGEYHTHDFYELELILNGAIQTDINGTIYQLSKGDLVLLTPLDVHKYIGLDKPIELINLAFISKGIEHNSFVTSVLSGNHLVYHLSEETNQTILFLIQKINREIHGNYLLNKRYTSFLLSCLIIELRRLEKNDELSTEKTEGVIKQALVYIRNHFKEPITLEDVAKEMNFSVSHASRLLQERLGCGFKKYLMELRLEYASNLLAHTDEDITEISYYSGYNSLSYFSRGFKQKFGISPAEYRRKMRKQSNN